MMMGEISMEKAERRTPALRVTAAGVRTELELRARIIGALP